MKNLEAIDLVTLDTVTGGNPMQNKAWKNIQHRWGSTSGVLTKDRNRQGFTVDPLWGGEAQHRSFSVHNGHAKSVLD